MSNLDAAKGGREEPIIQYDEPHAAGRDRRGVLFHSRSKETAVPWEDLNYALLSVHGAVGLNVVRFRFPVTLNPEQRQEAVIDIQAAFAVAFPGNSLPNVRIHTGRKAFKYIDVENPCSNVKANDIIKAAASNAWKVCGVLLQKPQFVGFQISELLFPIRFDKIPLQHKDEFISSIPDILRDIAPLRRFQIVDMWECQHKVTMKSKGVKVTNWIFGDSIVVLFRFEDALRDNNRIGDVVLNWPGWYCFREKYPIGLVYPGRFDYCGFCKFTAKDSDGEDKRHTLSKRKEIICKKCGGNGHYDTTCTKRQWDNRAQKKEKQSLDYKLAEQQKRALDNDERKLF